MGIFSEQDFGPPPNELFAPPSSQSPLGSSVSQQTPAPGSDPCSGRPLWTGTIPVKQVGPNTQNNGNAQPSIASFLLDTSEGVIAFKFKMQTLGNGPSPTFAGPAVMLSLQCPVGYYAKIRKTLFTHVVGNNWQLIGTVSTQGTSELAYLLSLAAATPDGTQLIGIPVIYRAGNSGLGDQGIDSNTAYEFGVGADDEIVIPGGSQLNIIIICGNNNALVDVNLYGLQVKDFHALQAQLDT